MRSNLSALIKEELVKRFENVVQEEIRSHNIAIEKSNRDITHLTNLFEDFKKLLENIKTQNSEDYQKLFDEFVKKLKKQEEAFEDQRRFIKKNASQMDEIAKNLQSNIDELLDIPSFNTYIQNVNDEFKRINEKFHDFDQNMRNYIFKEKQYISKHNQTQFSSVRTAIGYLRDQIEMIKKEIHTNKIDSDGVLKELQCYKKSMFIIEKKIENIYSQIERLKEKL